MRVMAGLRCAGEGGRVLADGLDVTGKPLRERHGAMVYVYRQCIKLPVTNGMPLFFHSLKPPRIE